MEFPLRLKQTLMLFLLVAAFAGFSTPRTFAYDAEYYWRLRENFLDIQRNFSLTNYADERYQLRGYVFPLLLLSAEWVVDVLTPDRWVDDYLTVAFFNSALFTLLAWWLLPAILAQLRGSPLSLRLRLLLAAILFLFLRGYLYYPLSDLPALLFLLTGVWATLQAAEYSGWRFAGLAAGAGASLAAAYIARPVYLLAFGAVGLAFLLARVKIWGWRSRFLGLMAFLLGGFLVLFPQYQINRIHYGVNSPFISGGLYTFQTTTGILLHRYETNVNEQVYPSAPVFFVDPQAERLLQRAGRGEVSRLLDNLHSLDLPYTITISDILSFFTRYPLDVTAIYFRHLFNGLTPMYADPYIRNLYAPDLGLLWLSYTVLFTVLVFFDLRPWLSANPVSGFALLAWVLPALAALPGAVEVRFLFPLQVLLVAAALSTLAHPPGLGEKIAHWGVFRLGLLYAAFLLMCFTLSGLILTTVPNSTLLLTPR
jgi:hypothetical protein